MKKIIVNQRKQRNRWKLVGITCIICASLVGCSASRSSSVSSPTETAEYNESAVQESYQNIKTDQVYDMSAEAAATAEAGGAMVDGRQNMAAEEIPAASPEVMQDKQPDTDLGPMSSRKLIRNIDLQVETKEFDQILVNMENKVAQLGGYVEMLNTNNGGYYGESRYSRNATIVARIPAEKAKDFVEHVEQNSNITSRNENVQDVTLEYVDLESRKKVLSIEMERLIVLLEKAEKLEDIFAIERRITEVSYELDGMESRLRNYDNLVEYSTVTLYIQEVASITAPQEAGTWEKISLGFEKNIVAVKQGLINFFSGVLISSPLILLWVIIIGLILVIVRQVYRMRKKRKGLKNSKIESNQIEVEVIESENSQKTPKEK